MDLIQNVSAAGAVLLLLGALLWWLRRQGIAHFRTAGPAGFGMRSRGRLLELVDRRVLGAGHAVYLLRVADRALVVAAHGSGCTLLESRPWAELETAAGQEARS